LRRGGAAWPASSTSACRLAGGLDCRHGKRESIPAVIPDK
jgi:hypothetical protein